MKTSKSNTARTTRPAAAASSKSVEPPLPIHAEIETATDVAPLAHKVAQCPHLIPDIFEGLKARKAKVKYGSLKILRLISETHPAVLYPSFERFLPLLDSDETIIKWGAILIIGNLAGVDSGHKIEAMLDRYLSPVKGPVMITASNVIKGAAKIAAAKPHLTVQITSALLTVEQACYATPECRNVALGHVLHAFGTFKVKPSKPVIAFVQRQTANPRKTVAANAAKLLKRL